MLHFVLELKKFLICYTVYMRSSAVFTALFWIATTYAGMTYGPVLVGRLTGHIPRDQFAQTLIAKTPGPIQSIFNKNADIASEEDGSVRAAHSSRPPIVQNLPPIPSSPREIPEYIREVVNTTTNQVIEKSAHVVTQTTGQATQNVCHQIVTEIQKKCDIQTSTE